MSVKRINKEQSTEEALAKQIGNLGGVPDVEDDEIGARTQNMPEAPVEAPKVGQKLQHYGQNKVSQDEMTKMDTEKHLSRIGERISTNADIRDGWMEVDRDYLATRNVFYPEDWVFRIKPATVEAIRNWSTIDENNPNSIDTVFDEILKSCLSIRTANGPLPWSQINTWDRFFFVLLIREYTFEKGETKVEFKRDCPNCGSEMTFTLNSQALMYDVPDEEVMNNYDRQTRTWHIYPADYDVDWTDEEVVLYVPTREKDNAIKDYIFSRVQQDRNAKLDKVFFKSLPWMLPKISKDANIARSQIRKAETDFNSWNTDMFSFMDEVINNIAVTPGTNLIANCESCGEEATAPIQFPDGISSLFAMAGRHKKFGKK